MQLLSVSAPYGLISRLAEAPVQDSETIKSRRKGI